MPTFYESIDTIYRFWDITYNRWLFEELFSFSWFLIVGNMVLGYIILFTFIDRSRLRELLFYGSLLAVAFGYVNVLGTSRGVWEFKTHFLPLTPDLFPLAYTVHPILHLLIYQYTSSWKSFAIVDTLATAFFAFIVQPVYVWAGVLWLGGWNYFYSFITALGITFFARAVVIWLANIEQNHATQPSRTSLAPKLQPAMKMLDEDNKEK